MTIPLINKTDYFEQVREAVASILVAETTRQQALAVSAGLDPALWKFRVFVERSNPWDIFLDSEDNSPVVNIRFDNFNTDLSKSNLTDRQQVTTRINVDVFAYAQSEETQAGHTAGDEQAARNAQATARYCRNILMHDDNKYLGLRGIVGKRWLVSLTTFDMPQNNPAIQRVQGARLSLDVDHLELAVQGTENVCEMVNVKIYYAADGELIAEINEGSEA